MISKWAQEFGLTVEPVTGQPGETINRVVAIFTTRDGSWEPSDKPGSVPQWARDTYLKPANHPQYFDDAGAAQNLFGAVMDNGYMVPRGTMHFWTYTDNQNHTDQRVKLSGWANIALWPSSSYVPDRGEKGPWAWQPKGIKSDVVKGGGLPQRWHVSTFAVWSPVTLPNVITPPVEPEPTQPETLEAAWVEIHKLWAIVNEWQGGK